MVEGGVRELVVLRLDPGPLDAEAEGIEAEPGHQLDVLAIPVVEVACVARRLDARRPWDVLPCPPVAVGNSAFDLVGRSCGAEEETFRKPVHQLIYIRDLPSLPRPEYPRPRLRRDQWINLNGEWEFAFDRPDFDRSIIVPFAYQSELSGIGQRTLHDTVWYRRRFDALVAERLILHFGAVDYGATVWVNGSEVARHEGSHTPFSADITGRAASA